MTAKGQGLSTAVLLRCSPEDLAAWRLKASGEALTLSAWMRRRLNSAE